MHVKREIVAERITFSVNICEFKILFSNKFKRENHVFINNTEKNRRIVNYCIMIHLFNNSNSRIFAKILHISYL